MILQQKLPPHPNPPPLIRVSGTHREMGRQIGEACTPQVLHSMENARKLFEDAYEQLELTWEGAKIQARKYMPFAQERYPQYVEEIMGIAEGAKVPFDDLAVLNAMEAVTSDALHLIRCTSLAVNGDRTADGHVLAAHSEDWMPEDEDDGVSEPNDPGEIRSSPLSESNTQKPSPDASAIRPIPSGKPASLPSVIISRLFWSAMNPSGSTLIQDRGDGGGGQHIHAAER